MTNGWKFQWRVRDRGHSQRAAPSRRWEGGDDGGVQSDYTLRRKIRYTDANRLPVVPGRSDQEKKWSRFGKKEILV